MVSNYGMSRALGPAYYEHGSEHPFLGNLVATESGASDSTVSTIESEARALLVKALERATSIIERHRSEHRKLLEALLSVETIEKAEIDALLGSRSPLGREPRVDAADERVLPLARPPVPLPEY